MGVPTLRGMNQGIDRAPPLHPVGKINPTVYPTQTKIPTENEKARTGRIATFGIGKFWDSGIKNQIGLLYGYGSVTANQGAMKSCGSLQKWGRICRDINRGEWMYQGDYAFPESSCSDTLSLPY